jgi:toxin ParE1/3/4
LSRYTVRVSGHAGRQLSELEQWIEREASPAIARRYREAIVARCRKLELFPERGTLRSDIRPGLRTLLFRRSVVVGYVVEGSTVTIVAVIGRGRDIAQALKASES